MNMFRSKRIAPVCLLLLAALPLQSCFTVSQRDVREVPVGVPARVEGEAKAHTYGGGVILYPHGFVMSDSLLVGEGQLFSLDRSSFVPVREYEVDSVLAIERLSQETDSWATPAAGITTAGVSFALLALILSLFFAFGAY